MSTKIEWTDETWPVVTGCTHAGRPGCDSCYAARMAATRLKHHPRYEGLATISGGKARWTGEVRLNHDVLEQPLRWRKPRRVFVASMGDLFHKDVPATFISEVWMRAAANPQHAFQILTKRPDRMLQYVTELHRQTTAVRPVSNIWLGVSVENQAAANARIPQLLQIPAAVRFVSVEPMLGPVILPSHGEYLYPDEFECNNVTPTLGYSYEPDSPINWVICGGESGPGARPMRPDRARSLRDQCRAAGVPFFFKSWGAWLGVDYDGLMASGKPRWSRADGLRAYVGKEPEVNFGDGHGAVRVGKKAAGNLLDGRTWQQFPAADGAGT